MTDSTGIPAQQAGWYADPAGSPRQRWWDGTQWTQHLHDPALETYGAVARPVVGPQTPVYNSFIWTIVLLPVLSIIALVFFDLTAYMEQYASLITLAPEAGNLPPSSTLNALTPDLGYVLLLDLLSFVVYAATVVLAVFDWRKLNRDGFTRPFHWAWSFLGAPVYVIGRSVIVNRRAGRGLTPIWVWAAITLVSIIVGVVKVVDATSALVSTLEWMPI